MAQRKFLPRDQAVRVDHPLGGVFWMRPLGTKDRLRYREELKESGVEFEGEGEETKVVVKSDLVDTQRIVDFVKERVDRVTEFTSPDGEPLESTNDLIDALLWELFEEEVEGTGPAEKVTRTKLTAAWALGEQVRLGMAHKEDEVKN